MSSTFWQDGFKDGKEGNKASPPQPYSFSGHTTNVHAAEYLQGWLAGHSQAVSDAMKGVENDKS